jgi:TrmH family RNA methyltransferase
MPPNRPIRIVLVRPRNPLNIGACARAMANFGLSELVVVEPFEPIWKEARAAPGAESLLEEARAVATWQEAVKECSLIIGTSSFHQRPFEQLVIELPNMNRYLASYPSSAPVALVFGSERSGLSNEELAACQAILHIPTERSVPSMNLGQALAIVLYELRRSGWEPPVNVTPAPALEIEPLIENLAALGETLDYPRGYKREDRLGRIRKALGAAVLPPSTVHYLLNFMRHIRKSVTDKNSDGR